MPIPEHHPKTLHLEPYHLNDSLAGIRIGKRRKYRFADQDANCTSDGVIVIKHWGTPAKDGFVWLTTSIPGRRMRDPHPHRAISDRTWAEVKRLRRRRVGGGRYRTAVEHAVACKRAGMVMCLEAKGSPGFKNAEVWRHFKAQLVGTGATVYVMTLQNIPGWKERLTAAHAAGFETALLPRGKRPLDWANYADWVKKWGAWR